MVDVRGDKRTHFYSTGKALACFDCTTSQTNYHRL